MSVMEATKLTIEPKNDPIGIAEDEQRLVYNPERRNA